MKLLNKKKLNKYIILVFMLIIYISLNILYGEVTNAKSIEKIKNGIEITTSCTKRDRCLFSREEIALPMTTKITNKTGYPVGIPLDFLKSGYEPSYMYLDTKSKEFIEYGGDPTPKVPLDDTLLEKIFYISNGESVSFEWIVKTKELKKYYANPVDALIQINIGIPITQKKYLFFKKSIGDVYSEQILYIKEFK